MSDVRFKDFGMSNIFTITFESIRCYSTGFLSPKKVIWNPTARAPVMALV